MDYSTQQVSRLSGLRILGGAMHTALLATSLLMLWVRQMWHHFPLKASTILAARRPKPFFGFRV